MEIFKRRGYTTFTRLDSGGQANVYLTKKGDKDFAIKVIHTEEPTTILTNTNNKVRSAAPKPIPNGSLLDDDLKRELQIVKNLHHPNCIHVEEIFRTRNKFYIVMDYMPNGNIGNIIREMGPICEWNTKLWFCPVARALKYLHSHKIAHR